MVLATFQIHDDESESLLNCELLRTERSLSRTLYGLVEEGSTVG